MPFWLRARMGRRNHVLDGGPAVLMDVAMATSFLGLNLLLTGFVWTIATWQLVMKGVWVVGRQNADTADTLRVRNVAMATIFWLSIYGMHIGATWCIRLNRPCSAAMRPYVKLLWPLVRIWDFIPKHSHISQYILTVSACETRRRCYWIHQMSTLLQHLPSSTAIELPVKSH